MPYILAPRPTIHPMTAADFERLLDANQLFIGLNDGTYQRARRNGRTQTWVKTPSRRRIPFKYGFKGYGAFDNDWLDDNGHVPPRLAVDEASLIEIKGPITREKSRFLKRAISQLEDWRNNFSDPRPA